MGSERFPAGLAVLQQFVHTAEERAWVASLPGLVSACEQRWRLRRIGAPFPTGMAAWTAPVEMADGTPAVLKISWPHREAREEAAALRLWDGDGAVRLYAEDRDDFALLVERCDPGTRLSVAGLADDAALEVAGELLARLWACAAPSPARDVAARFERVGDVTHEWAALLRDRMARLRPAFDTALVARAADLLETLPSTATREVVIHGDFNPGNVLAAGREPWLAIDPKPMLGDPGYDPAPLLAQVGEPYGTRDPVRVVQHRFARFATIVREPADRMLAWAFARTVEAALWSLSRGSADDAERGMADATVLARSLGV